MNSLRIKITIVVLMLLVVTIDALIPLGIACGILYTGAVLMAQQSRNSRLIVWVATISTLLTISKYLLAPLGDTPHWVVLTNRILSIYVIWVTALMALKINKQHTEEVKSLSGLLPICAWCKNIRNDQGYWTQLEAFLNEHTEAEFSHSICPGCMEAHFAEMSKRLEG